MKNEERTAHTPITSENNIHPLLLSVESARQLISHYYKAVRLPLCLFRKDELISRLPALQDFNLPLLLMGCLDAELPSVWYAETPEHLYFGGLKLKTTDETLVLGPVMPFACSTRQADTILSRIGRTTKDRQTLISYFTSLPVCDAPTLQANLVFLDILLNGSEHPMHHLPFQWKELLPSTHISPFYPEKPDEDWIERTLLSYVKYGQLEELNHFFNTYILASDLHLDIADSTVRLRMMRDYILGANMLISHAAMDGGLDYGLGMQMNGEYISLIQNAPTETDLSNIFFQLAHDYTRRVAQLKKLSSGTPLIRQINQHIHSHLYEKVTPSSIAAALERNCTYLCTCFKNETGKTIANYIQECKIDEAKRLLEFGRLSIVEISELLCFSNASYFCRIFKKWSKMSPAQFRRNDKSSTRFSQNAE